MALFHEFFATVGVAGFLALWVVKATLGVAALRWLANWRARRSGLK